MCVNVEDLNINTYQVMWRCVRESLRWNQDWEVSMDDDVEDFLFCFVNNQIFGWEHQIYEQTETFRSFFSLQSVGLTTGGRCPPAVSQFDISTWKKHLTRIIQFVSCFCLFLCGLWICVVFSSSQSDLRYKLQLSDCQTVSGWSLQTTCEWFSSSHHHKETVRGT